MEQIYHLESSEGLYRLVMFFGGFFYTAVVEVVSVDSAQDRGWMSDHLVLGLSLLLGIPGAALLPFRRWRWMTLGIAIGAGLGFLILYAIGSALQQMYRGF